MPTNDDTNISTRPMCYIAVTGTSAKSCKNLRLLLKNTNYYCVVDCYKSTDDLAIKEAYYLPDLVIMELRSLYSLYSIDKKIATLKSSFPGITLLLYYNMWRKYPLLAIKKTEHPELHSHFNEKKQVDIINAVLKNRR